MATRIVVIRDGVDRPGWARRRSSSTIPPTTTSPRSSPRPGTAGTAARGAASRKAVRHERGTRRNLFVDLPYLLGGHLLLSISAVLIGVLISVPFGAVATRNPKRLRASLLTTAGLIQTIPGLALLALMVPLLGGTIGFLPAFIALTLYSVLPMLQQHGDRGSWTWIRRSPRRPAAWA